MSHDDNSPWVTLSLGVVPILHQPKITSINTIIYSPFNFTGTTRTLDFSLIANIFTHQLQVANIGLFGLLLFLPK